MNNCSVKVRIIHKCCNNIIVINKKFWAAPIIFVFVWLEMKAVTRHPRVGGLIGKKKTKKLDPLSSPWLTLKMEFEFWCFLDSFFLSHHSFYFYFLGVLYYLSSACSQASIFTMIEHGTHLPHSALSTHMPSLNAPMHSLFPLFLFPLLYHEPAHGSGSNRWFRIKIVDF